MGEQKCPKNIPHLHNIEGRPSETNVFIEKSASPSVAQLAGKFQDQKTVPGKETPARRKPPCSLPLRMPKPEFGQNGELKPSPNASHPPRVKVKSSPLIEKLQANLAFAPASLLPGSSPKSPGLKVMVSPFSSPPSTPSSPRIRISSNDSDEMPVSFDQPPEGSHLQFYNKVRTRGSLKRRPPSRRFRRSQSECGDDQDLGVTVSPQENGAKETEEDGVFTDKTKTLKSRSPRVDGPGHHHVKQTLIASDEKTPSGQESRKPGSNEREMGREDITLHKDSKEEKPPENLLDTQACEHIKEDKGKSPNNNSADDTEGKSQKNREHGHDSDQETKEEGDQENQVMESEDTQQVSITPDTEMAQPAGDAESAVNTRV